MSASKQDIAVIYIVWLPFGLDPLQSFIESYLKHPAGVEHELTIVFKGEHITESAIESCYQLLQQKNIQHKALYHSKGLDIDTYFYAASQVSTTYCMFLNSKSMLLSDNWLQKMWAAIQQDKIGVVAATGTYQSHSSAVYTVHPWKWEHTKTFAENFRKYKVFIKAFVWWQWWFKLYPNPHIRTNAFLINRGLFLSLTHKPAINKFDAYKFESGRMGITNQLLKKGLKPVLINKEGHLFEIKDWYNSFVYRSGSQQGLMISDNQTEVYQNANPEEKRKLTFLSWGRYE
jgi:hypothetical protein